jgi:hypothetical protein
VQLEGLDALKKFNELIGSRTRDHPACSIAPQPSMLQLILQLMNATINTVANECYS